MKTILSTSERTKDILKIAIKTLEDRGSSLLFVSDKVSSENDYETSEKVYDLIQNNRAKLAGI